MVPPVLSTSISVRRMRVADRDAGRYGRARGGSTSWPADGLGLVYRQGFIEKDGFMLSIVLVFLGAWLYGIVMLVYMPAKIIVLKCRSLDVWAYLSRGRLAAHALIYLIGAPLPWLLGEALVLGSTAGNHAAVASDAEVSVAWGLCFFYVAMATISLVLMFVRPKPHRNDSAS
jgi:hypothetical protein